MRIYAKDLDAKQARQQLLDALQHVQQYVQQCLQQQTLADADARALAYVAHNLRAVCTHNVQALACNFTGTADVADSVRLLLPAPTRQHADARALSRNVRRLAKDLAADLTLVDLPTQVDADTGVCVVPVD